MRKIITLLLFSWIAFASQASIQKTINLLSTNLNESEIIVNGVTYSSLSVDGWSQKADTSGYLLPAYYLSYSIPCTAENVSVKINSVSSYFDVQLNHNLAVQIDATAGSDTKTIGGINHGNIPYPFNGLVTVESVGYVGGCNKIVTVCVTPVHINSGADNVRVYGPITFTINWNSIVPTTGSLTPISSGSPSYTQDAIRYVKGIVENPQSVISNSFGEISPLTTDQEDYPYIIITPAKFETSLRRLAAVRQARGYGAEVFTIENILNDSRFATGDEISGLNDDAGKLRAFLTYAFKIFGTRHVLLAGDATVIPARYGYAGGDYPIATDLYYSELNNKWSLYANNSYKTNYTDYRSELYVGRIPFESEADIDVYISKILNYEFNPGLGDSGYLNKMFYTRQDTLVRRNCFSDDQLSSLFNVFGINNIVDYSEKTHRQSTPSGAQIVNVSERYCSPRRSTKQAETMIVEGRTWWYYTYNIILPTSSTIPLFGLK